MATQMERPLPSTPTQATHFFLPALLGVRHALVHPNHEGIHIMDARQALSGCAGSYLACPGLQVGQQFAHLKQIRDPIHERRRETNV